MTISEPAKRPAPQAPGYGDRGPAGAGRDGESDNEAAAEGEDEPEPVNDLGG